MFLKWRNDMHCNNILSLGPGDLLFHRVLLFSLSPSLPSSLSFHLSLSLTHSLCMSLMTYMIVFNDFKERKKTWGLKASEDSLQKYIYKINAVVSAKRRGCCHNRTGLHRRPRVSADYILTPGTLQELSF